MSTIDIHQPSCDAAGMAHRTSFEVATRGRGTYDITDRVASAIAHSGVGDGLATVFVHHTSASLIVCENADASVRRDLETFFGRLVPDGDAMFTHDAEGDDDMPAHVRTVLTQTSIAVPVADGRPDLGTWQGLYLWEHRSAPHRRKVSVTVVG
jgi:secondary thiamine-phosphate synthase enzyme